MPRAVMELPVFLPGNNRDWVNVDGIATVTTEGEVIIRLKDPSMATRLVDMAQERVLLQIAFDYRQSDEILEKIHSRYRKVDPVQDGFLEAARQFQIEAQLEKRNPPA